MPAVLLVLICVLVLIVYKCKRQKIKGIFWIHRHAQMYRMYMQKEHNHLLCCVCSGNEAAMNRNTSKTGGLEEVIGAAENGVRQQQTTSLTIPQLTDFILSCVQYSTLQKTFM